MALIPLTALGVDPSPIRGDHLSVPDALTNHPPPRPKLDLRRFGAWRIRRKLMALHTVFSIALAFILLLALRPAIRTVVQNAEEHACRAVIELIATTSAPPPASLDGMTIRLGSAEALQLTEAEASRIRSSDEPVRVSHDDGWPTLAAWLPDRAAFVAVSAKDAAARAEMLRLYTLTVVALLVVYFLIALALEVFVLPKNVWRPIARLREADAAVQEGRREVELIPESEMPRDELGEIMRSRNDSIRKLREHEDALARALDRLELVATDLKRKNHLLESVQRNMADQDRLVSLGMMSAGLAHELNTPLAVLKGAVEQIAENPSGGVAPARAHLLLRTVNRLERLSENLLDFARVRPHTVAPVPLRRVIDESWELVRIDREAAGIDFDNAVPEDAVINGDADRLTQVFVNILRNAADAIEGDGRIGATAERASRHNADWISIHIRDSGPGVDPSILPRLFEPFTTTRLDSRGTGLGLAVADGIVREHGGVILANNAPDGGADFEIMLPVHPPAAPTSPDANS